MHTSCLLDDMEEGECVWLRVAAGEVANLYRMSCVQGRPNF